MRYTPPEMEIYTEPKEGLRREINAQVALFLANGGEIEYLERGDSCIDKPSKVLKLKSNRVQ